MVLEHGETAGCERPHSKGLKESRVERKTERRKHWSELSVRVITKGKREGR